MDIAKEKENVYTFPMAKTKTAPKKKTTAKTTSASSSKSKITVADLKKNVMDPKNRKPILIALVVVVLAVAAYFGKSLFIAAVVNGQPVSRLSIIRELEKQNGKATLEAAITRVLINQEAAKKKISVTQKDIDAEAAKLKKDFESQGQNLDQFLATQGWSTERFREEIRIQLVVTKLLGDQVKVSDKEFNDFLAKNPDILTQEKDQNAAKAMLRSQLEQQKLGQKYQEWIATIRKNAKVNSLVSY